MVIKQAETREELLGILDLQASNLLPLLDSQEMADQGFVTVRHSLEQLESMNQIARHVIALDGDRIVGYILAMTKASRSHIPVLIPMFKQFDSIRLGEKTVSDYDYLVIGQVCVAKSHRGQGLFDRMYTHYRSCFLTQFDFAITEIALSNPRSLRAHERVGFRTIHEFEDFTQAWAIVAWDWKSIIKAGQNQTVLV